MDIEISIRPATKKDVDPIYAFTCHLEEAHFDRIAFQDRFEDLLEDPYNVCLVSVNAKDEVNGFITCHGLSVLHKEARIFEVQELYVARPARGVGVAKALFSAMQENVLSMGGRAVEVTADAKRSDTRKLFTKLGFASTLVKYVKEL